MANLVGPSQKSQRIHNNEVLFDGVTLTLGKCKQQEVADLTCCKMTLQRIK